MSTLKNTCEFVVGHLLEIRVSAGYRTVADVDDMIGLIGRTVARLPTDAKYSIAADWRAVQVMAPETSARVTRMLEHVNPRVHRSAILTLAEHPTTNLQVVRVVREAQNRDRRHFTDPYAMQGWLSEVLTREESARLRVFLSTP